MHSCNRVHAFSFYSKKQRPHQRSRIETTCQERTNIMIIILKKQAEDELDSIDTQAARERLENGEAEQETEDMLSQLLTGEWEPVTLPSQEENKPVPDKSNAANFHISYDRLGEGSPKEKFQRNVAA